MPIIDDPNRQTFISSVSVLFFKFNFTSKCECSVAACGLRPIRRWKVTGDGRLEISMRTARRTTDNRGNQSLIRSSAFPKCHRRDSGSPPAVQGHSVQCVSHTLPAVISCRKSHDRDCGRKHYAVCSTEKRPKSTRDCGRVHKGRAFKTDRTDEHSLNKLSELQLVTGHGLITSAKPSTSSKTQGLSSDAAFVALDDVSDFMLPDPNFQFPVVLSRRALDPRAQITVAPRMERTSDFEPELLTASSFVLSHSGYFPRNVSIQVCRFININRGETSCYQQLGYCLKSNHA